MGQIEGSVANETPAGETKTKLTVPSREQCPDTDAIYRLVLAEEAEILKANGEKVTEEHLAALASLNLETREALKAHVVACTSCRDEFDSIRIIK